MDDLNFSAGVLETALWLSEGRRFSHVATWRRLSDLKLTASLYPNKQLGLNGRHLLIGTNIVRTKYSCQCHRLFSVILMCPLMYCVEL